MCTSDWQHLLSKLGSEDISHLMRGARAARQVEQKTHHAFEAYFRELETKCLLALHDGLEPPKFDVTMILLHNAYNAMHAAFTVIPRVPKEDLRKRLAEYKGTKLPSTPAELRIWWDMTRKNKAPVRIQRLADAIRKAYLKKTQALWQKYSETFRKGSVWNQDEAKAVIKEIFRVPKARAATITDTETTRYYNTARRNFYDKEDTVTHYLFIAIRDAATTQWCKTRQGLIYEKGSEYLKKETPPIHYRCRSEIVPLSPFNKLHAAMIRNPELQRKNKKIGSGPGELKALPKDWNKAL